MAFLFWSAALAAGAITLLIRLAYPRPIPGIPHNHAAARSLMGDLPEIRKSRHVRPWFLQQCQIHQSAIVQIFRGLFTSPSVIISDYREVNDLLTRRHAEFCRGLKNDAFAGILPHAHPSLETFDPRFKENRELVKDLMTPSFLDTVGYEISSSRTNPFIFRLFWLTYDKVSAPQTRDAAIGFLNLLQLKARIANGRPFDLTEDLSQFAFDIIASAATGPAWSKSHIGRQLAGLELAAASGSFIVPVDNVRQPVDFPTSQASELLKALRVDEQSLWLAFYMPSPKIYYFLNKLRPSVRLAARETRAHIKSRILESVQRILNGGHLQCALDYIVQREVNVAKEANRLPMFDDPRIRDELYTYLLAGHDTIAGSLSWMIRRLSAWPEIQKRVRLDLRQTYSEAWVEARLPTILEMKKHSPYLDAFIEEVLRHDSPIPTTALTAREDTIILGHPIPKETYLFLNLTGPSFTAPSIAVEDGRRSGAPKLGNDARMSWDDSQPASFNPERWLKREADGRLSFDPLSGPMLAFSAGPRGCFGKRLVRLQLRITLTLLIWSLEFDTVSEELNSFWDVDEFIVTVPKKCFVKVSAAT